MIYKKLSIESATINNEEFTLKFCGLGDEADSSLTNDVYLLDSTIVISTMRGKKYADKIKDAVENHRTLYIAIFEGEES